MLSPTTVTPASTVKLWPVFAGLTVTLEKLPVMYCRSIALTLLLDCVIWTLFNVTFKMEDQILQDTSLPTKTLPPTLPDKEPAHIASAARTVDTPPKLAARTTTTAKTFAVADDDGR